MDNDTIDKLKSILSNGNIPDEFKNVLSNLGNSNNSESINNSNNSDNSTSSNNIDFETIIKFKTIIDKMNSQNDPRSKLLSSLKPYLKDSRKNKIDQYIKFLNMSSLLNYFSSGDDKK